MKVLNKTHYWHDLSKFYNIVSFSHSFASESARRNSCYLRLHYEFEYTKKIGGQTFFVTFTYNDKSIPKFGKYNVFDYSHIRLISNGVLSKRLLREYGSKLKYFCSCESGEGGTPQHHARGIGNNPHYHFIFFVQPNGTDYNPISPKDFKSICQEVWQGRAGYFPWQYARFGSVKEGKLGIVVKDSRAFKYVSKYVIKDAAQLSIEEKVRDLIVDREIKKRDTDYFYSAYAQSIFSLKGIPVANTLDEFKYHLAVATPERSKFLSKYYHWFNTEMLPVLVESAFNEFKNKHSGKVRCSKSLGEYGLQFVQDPDSNPHFKVDEKKKVKVYKLPLYYQRKLYFDTFICPYTQSVLYVLNDRGKNLRLATLSTDISKLYNRVIQDFKFVLDNDVKYYYKTDLIDTVSYARQLYFSSDFLSLAYKYSVYCKVYRHRIYGSGSPVLLSDSFLFSDILQDYDFFLDLDRFHIDFEESSIQLLLSRNPDSREFIFNPIFFSYSSIFDFIDSVLDSVSDIRSDSKKRAFQDSSDYLKTINSYVNSST